MSDYRIEAATKEEWAARALMAEERLAEAVKVLEPLTDHWGARVAGDPAWRDMNTVQIEVTIGELRRAKTFLAAIQPKDATT